MTIQAFIKGVKNVSIILVTIAGAIASLEKLSQLDLKADSFESKDKDEK